MKLVHPLDIYLFCLKAIAAKRGGELEFQMKRMSSFSNKASGKYNIFFIILGEICTQQCNMPWRRPVSDTLQDFLYCMSQG